MHFHPCLTPIAVLNTDAADFTNLTPVDAISASAEVVAVHHCRMLLIAATFIWIK
jgi:hypothetical protein